MLIIAAILIAIIIPLFVVGLSFTHLRSGFLWLLVVFGAFIAWLLVIFAGRYLPIEIPLPVWSSEFFFGSSPALLIDEIAWPFSVVVMTLCVAVLLTDVVHIRVLDPQVWASSLALGGVGLLAVIAGNPITLLLAWAILDISELVVLLFRVNGSSERERVVIAFSVRVAGIFLFMAAFLRAQALAIPLTFQSMPAEVNGIILLACSFHLGVIPPVQPYLGQVYLRRGLGTFARLVPVASGLVLGLRVATSGTDDLWQFIFTTLATATILYASIKWFQAADELQGRSYWILGMAAFALLGAAQGLVYPSAAWGFALFFSGAALFLFSVRQRYLFVFPILGVIGFCALPLTPAWEGIRSLAAISWIYRLVLLIALAIFIVGYLKHAQAVEHNNGGFERWMWLVYPLGLSLMPMTHFGFVYLQMMQRQDAISIFVPGWWYGALSFVLALLILYLRSREMISMPLRFMTWMENFNLDWLSRFFWGAYRLTGRLIELFSKLLEGEGGVLWALLVLILLVVSLSVINTGDGFEF